MIVRSQKVKNGKFPFQTQLIIPDTWPLDTILDSSDEKKHVCFWEGALNHTMPNSV